MLVLLCLCIKAVLNPPSLKTCENEINTINRPIFPISKGSKSRVSMIPIIAVTPCTENFSKELQISPPKILDGILDSSSGFSIF